MYEDGGMSVWGWGMGVCEIGVRVYVEWGHGCMWCIPAGGRQNEEPFSTCISDRLSGLPLLRETPHSSSLDHPERTGVLCL